MLFNKNNNYTILLIFVHKNFVDFIKHLETHGITYYLF